MLGALILYEINYFSHNMWHFDVCWKSWMNWHSCMINKTSELSNIYEPAYCAAVSVLNLFQILEWIQLMQMAFDVAYYNPINVFLCKECQWIKHARTKNRPIRCKNTFCRVFALFYAQCEFVSALRITHSFMTSRYSLSGLQSRQTGA